MSYKSLKQSAKFSLKGKYTDAIIITFLNSILTTFIMTTLLYIYGTIIIKTNTNINININSLIISFITLFSTGLFFFGEQSFYLQISRNQKTSYTELFKRTNMWWGYICITLITSLFIFLWSLLFIIPGIIASINYQFVFLIKTDTPHISTIEAIRQSKNILHGNRIRLIGLYLSFIGWFLLGILSLGIGFIWIIPYTKVTIANFYNSLIPDIYLPNKYETLKSNYNIETKEELYIKKNKSNNKNDNQKDNLVNNTNNPPTSIDWNVSNINTAINNINNNQENK